MAVVSSHTLNGSDGTHAVGIAVSLRNLITGEMLFDTAMDDGGRLVQDIAENRIDPAAKPAGSIPRAALGIGRLATGSIL